eukprot:670480-Heterocapsa_arctica.AAC.1
MLVTVDEMGITFSVQGDSGVHNVMLKPEESGSMEEGMTLTVHEPVAATFALHYLKVLSEAVPTGGH